MKSKVFSIPQVGEVLICKHHNAKRLSIKLRPNEAPKVIIPKLMSFTMGFRFAMEKTNWIIEHAKILKEKTVSGFRFNDETVVETRFHKIKIGRHKAVHVGSKKEDGLLTVVFPATADIASEQNQELLRKFVTHVLRTEAKAYLPKRTQWLAGKFGFTINDVRVKNLKSRWGSCSSKNSINLNIHLMRLPEHLSDFIILHELCHTVHRNHGPQFHALLNQLCGNEKALNKELKKYSTQF
ncbi:MAG: M48 family metallopeptidase [Salinivirgaceae bacterium]